MNLGEIRDEIRLIVRDTDTDTDKQRYSDAQLNARINQAQERVAALTKCVHTRYSDNLDADTAEYNLPEYCIGIINVQVKDANDNWYPLTKTTERELDTLNKNWRSYASDTTLYWYQRRNKIGFYPYPETTRTSVLRIDMYRRPDSLTLDAEIPFEGIYELYPFHDILCYDVTRKCFLDSGQTQDAANAEAEFQKRVREIAYQMAERDEGTRMVNVYEKDRINSRRATGYGASKNEI